MAEHEDLNQSKAQERPHCPPAFVMEDVTPELPISDAELEALELLLGADLQQFLQSPASPQCGWLKPHVRDQHGISF